MGIPAFRLQPGAYGFNSTGIFLPDPGAQRRHDLRGVADHGFPTGRMFIAMREDEVAAQSVDLHLSGQVLSFVISTFMAARGAFFAHHAASSAPTRSDWTDLHHPDHADRGGMGTVIGRSSAPSFW